MSGRRDDGALTKRAIAFIVPTRLLKPLHAILGPRLSLIEPKSGV